MPLHAVSAVISAPSKSQLRWFNSRGRMASSAKALSGFYETLKAVEALRHDPRLDFRDRIGRFIGPDVRILRDVTALKHLLEP